MIDLAAAYAETHRSLADAVRGLPPERLVEIVPASPAWSVKDVVGHLTGVARLAVTGDAPEGLDLLGSLQDPEQARIRDELNDAEVAARRDVPLTDVLAEWNGYERRLLPMMRGEEPFPAAIPFLENIVVTDLAVHTQDIRNTLGMPGDRDSAGVGTALAGYAAGLGLKIQAAGLPALRLRYSGKERVVGDGEPAATLTADRYEIFRALCGRRSRAQVLAMGWEGDPEPYLSLIPAYGERQDDLVEPPA